jgi:hypothetical protein
MDYMPLHAEQDANGCANDDLICVIKSAIEINDILIEQLTFQSATAHRPASLGWAGLKIASIEISNLI